MQLSFFSICLHSEEIKKTRIINKDVTTFGNAIILNTVEAFLKVRYCFLAACKNSCNEFRDVIKII